MRDAAHVFTDLKDGAKSVRPSYYFMMRSLLHSRIDTGHLSNQNGEDEDVNVYLAHLLLSLADPCYLDQTRPYLHKYDHEVFSRVAGSKDTRFKYEVYKSNADFLLASLGVFENRSQALLNQLPGNPAYSRHKELETDPGALMDRGATYYKFAHGYSLVVNTDNPGVSEVLDKLASRFESYVKLLNHMCREYLDLVHALSRGEMYHLERFLNEEQTADRLRRAQDAFLDAYADWKREPTGDNEARLGEAVEDVKRWDPTFKFDP